MYNNIDRYFIDIESRNKNLIVEYFSLQIMLNSFTELLLPDTRTNSFLFGNEINKTKPFGQDSFDISRTPEKGGYEKTCSNFDLYG